MIALTSDPYLTPEAYLELEKHSETRHEYIDGEVYAMAGATRAHNIISLNLTIALRNRLGNSSCQTYMADIKVKLSQGKNFFYPDLVVSCDEDEDLSLNYVNSPKLIVEVLSESTEGFDRGDKFKFYRTIPSLKEYILVSSHQYSVDCFRRAENNFWVLQSYQGLDSTLHIESLNIDVSLGEIYATIGFEPEKEE